jgi:predicted  nucleic acid-binding Zn-ribbon protein
MSEHDGAPGSPGADSGPLQLLLALQDEDVHADQLAHRRSHLPEQVELDALLQRLKALDESASEVVDRRRELARSEAELESEIAEVVARIGAIEHRAASATAASYRDQEAMAAEVDLLGRRRADLEEHELAVLEESEPLDAELRIVAANRQDLVQQIDAAHDSVARAATLVDAEIAESAARRVALAAVVPTTLLEEYERLRSRLDGVGVARLVRGTCAGCHLALPATEVDRLHRAAPGTVVHCDQCGRILVP